MSRVDDLEHDMELDVDLDIEERYESLKSDARALAREVDELRAECERLRSAHAALESRLARIAALVKPIPVADLVEAGNNAPALLAERHRQIRVILEEEG